MKTATHANLLLPASQPFYSRKHLLGEVQNDSKRPTSHQPRRYLRTFVYFCITPIICLHVQLSLQVAASRLRHLPAQRQYVTNHMTTVTSSHAQSGTIAYVPTSCQQGVIVDRSHCVAESDHYNISRHSTLCTRVAGHDGNKLDSASRLHGDFAINRN